MLVIATNTGENIVAPHLQTSSVPMVMKRLWGSWLCKPKKTEVQKREDGRGGEERKGKGGEGRGGERKRKRKETEVVPPTSRGNAIAFYGKLPLSLLQNFSVLMEGR